MPYVGKKPADIIATAVDTTTGTFSGDIDASTVNATGDTAAGDNAAIGFTSAEGLILTGQGSTSDITVKNDADATVFTVPTGTDDILFPDSAEIQMGAGVDLKIFSDGTNGAIRANNGRVFIQTDTGVNLTKTGNAETMLIATPDGSVDLYHNNVKKFETTSSGVIVDNKLQGASGESLTIESQSGGAVILNTNGANERLRVTSAGDVGIGTTSITARLDVIDTGDADKQIVFGNNTTYFGSIGHNAGTGANIYTTENNGHHKFLMASTEHVRIDLNGNLLVGRTDNPSGVTDGIYVTGAYAQTASSSANMFINSEGRMMRSTSSLRYKNTINDATHGLTEVLALRPVTFKGNNDGDTIFGGLIAEEVHDVGLTEFVQYNDDNQPDALNYGNMVSLCIKAIQELKAENTALANRITAIEGA